MAKAQRPIPVSSRLTWAPSTATTSRAVTGNQNAMDNGQSQYVGDDSVGNQVNLSGSTGTDPVQIRTLNDVYDSAVAMDEGQVMYESDGSLNQGAGSGNQAANVGDDGNAITGTNNKAMYNTGDDSALAMDTGKAQSADAAAMDNGQAQDAFIANQANNSSTAQTGLTNNNGAGNAQTGLANNNGAGHCPGLGRL